MEMVVNTLFLVLFSCAAIAGDIKFESDVKVKKADQADFVSLKAGDKLSLGGGDSYIVINPQSLPFVIVSAQSSSEITITNRDFQSALNEQLSSTINARTNEIVDGLRKTESLLLKKDFSQALASASKLKEKYPEVSSILFLRATTLSLLNNRKEALDDLDKGLAIDPQNTAAVALKKKLTDFK